MKKLEAVFLAVGIAIAVPIGQALLTFNNATFDDPWPWVRSLAIGVAVALGAVVYKWGQVNGPVVTISKRVQDPAATLPLTYREPKYADLLGTPSRPQTAAPMVLPEGWAANQPQAPEATSASPPV